ncbi:2OG-Fe(II) oxygenase family protein [Planktomarina temperata]|nr:2OG-Fe(II) oxygenase family protein [Planktomarina temperata]
MQKNTLYETPVWVGKVGLTNEELKKLRDCALEAERKGVETRRSNRGLSFHTELNFLGPFSSDFPGALKIAKAYQAAALDYGFKLREASFTYWSIVGNKYSYSARHEHGTAMLSGVLYVTTPEGSGNLRFCDPRPVKRMMNGEHYVSFRDKDDPRHNDVEITPGEGLLVVFPSWLEHEVTMTMSEEPRIIYSFNMKPVS